MKEVAKMPITEAQKKATLKYRAKTYDKFMLEFPKGEREPLKEHASSRGESLAGFIKRAIKETIERDNAPQQAKTAVKNTQKLQEIKNAIKNSADEEMPTIEPLRIKMVEV
ncbi:MAG: hypothetical protein FWG64_03485 [Firmicutes bacterium]|nr:hypothetical protein [Bacillota bacterium]